MPVPTFEPTMSEGLSEQTLEKQRDNLQLLN